MNKKIVSMMLVPLLLVGACGSNAGDGDGDEQEKIVIGNVADFSGDYSFYDGPYRKGLEYAAAEINKNGGIDGKQVELLTIDTHSDQATAVRGIEEAIDAGAVYIVGTTNVGDWLAQAAVACKEGVPISTGDGTSGDLVSSAGDCAFQVIMSNPIQAGAIAEYAVDHGLTTAVVLESSDDNYHQEFARLFPEAYQHYGGEILETLDFRMGASDYNVQATKIAELDPDVVFSSMYTPDTPQFLRQLRAAGVTAPFYSTDGSIDDSVLAAGESAEGLVATFHAWPSDDNDLEKWIHEFDPEVDPSLSPQSVVSALGYDELYMIKQAAEASESTTSEGIMSGLKGLEFEGITGDLRIDPETRQATKSLALLEVKDGAYVFLGSVTPDYIPGQ